MKQWPEIREFKDITITPLFPGSRKSGGLKFATDQPDAILGHHRFGNPESIVEVVPTTDADLEGLRTVEEPTIYGGLLFNHFGHALAESIHRLWPMFAHEELGSAKVAFSRVKGAKLVAYMAEALSLHGILQEQVITIGRPLHFRRLIVGPQARHMAGPTLIPGYQSMLDDRLGVRFPTTRRDRRLYVSRLEYLQSGSFYGESELSRQLAADGFEIVYPEKHSLSELVAMLRESAIAVFAEGSAIHALELCGSTVPDVLVISRRQYSEWRFATLLTNICQRWKISDHRLLNVGMSDDKKKHSAVLDLPAVMYDIQAFCGPGGSRRASWSQSWAREAIREDVDRLIGDVRENFAGDHAGRAAELREAILRVESPRGFRSVDR